MRTNDVPMIEVEPKIEPQEEMVFERQGNNFIRLGKGVHLGDIDKMLETVERHMPIVNTEQVYFWELQKHERIYIALTVLGFLMVLLGILISF